MPRWVNPKGATELASSLPSDQRCRITRPAVSAPSESGGRTGFSAVAAGAAWFGAGGEETVLVSREFSSMVRTRRRTKACVSQPATTPPAAARVTSNQIVKDSDQRSPSHEKLETVSLKQVEIQAVPQNSRVGSV